MISPVRQNQIEEEVYEDSEWKFDYDLSKHWIRDFEELDFYNRTLKMYRAARSAETSQELFMALAKAGNAFVRLILAANEKITMPIIESLIDSTDLDLQFQVRKAIIQNPSTSLGLILEWNKSEWPTLQEVIAENLRIPKETLVEMSRNADPKSRLVRAAVAKNQNTPVEILESLASDEDPWVRCVVADNPRTPEVILIGLSSDWAAATHVAKNPSSPISLLKILSVHEDHFVKHSVAINPSTPIETLEKLAVDNDAFPRQGVAANLQTPLAILEKLSTDIDVCVREAVARNGNSTEEILNVLANDSDYQVPKAVASNINAPAGLLEKMIKDDSYHNLHVREAVAENKRTSVGVLEILAGDVSSVVRWAVARNSNTPVDTLLEMLTSTSFDYETKFNAAINLTNRA